MVSKPVTTDLDFRGRSTARGMREPLEADEAATRGFVVARINDLPIDQSDPGDITLIFENGLV